ERARPPIPNRSRPLWSVLPFGRHFFPRVPSAPFHGLPADPLPTRSGTLADECDLLWNCSQASALSSAHAGRESPQAAAPSLQKGARIRRPEICRRAARLLNSTPHHRFTRGTNLMTTVPSRRFSCCVGAPILVRHAATAF